MEQKPMRGAAPLDPPSPEIARLYLDEVDRVIERRDDQVNLRAQGWVTIVQGLLLAGFVGCTTVASRGADTTASMLLLLGFVMAIQVLSGLTERFGGQRRFTRWRGLYYTAVVIACVAIVATFGMSLVTANALPLGVVLAPAALGVLVLVGIGACQLWLARGTPRGARRERPAFVWPARGTTLAFGVLLGIMIVTAAYADALLTSLVTVLAAIALVVASLGSGTDWGLAYLGEVWRWPQFLMLAAGLVALAASVVVSATTHADPLIFVPVAAALVIVAVLVALVPPSPKAERRA
jgi:hypothetical protein